MNGAYYNEIDPKAAATLRELIAEGLIAPGYVDERSIEDVLPSELTGYTQVHLFAGFGIWSLALRMAGWGDSRPVWTASCPCQPFSAAGKGNGFADERHLWPSVFWLLQHGKRAEIPIYGEQVASPDGLTWLDLVRADLETIKHSCWSTVLASAGFGAPIIRQRTYWLASASSERWERRPDSERCVSQNSTERSKSLSDIERISVSSGLGSSIYSGLERYAGNGDGASGRHESIGSITKTSESCGMGSANSTGLQARNLEPISTEARSVSASQPSLFSSDRGTGATNGFWRHADWLRCRDDKWRPVEPGTFPLAHGYPERVGILRGAGNAISPQVAAAFIEATGGLL